MPTAFSYARFSSGKQKYGSSLERQQGLVAGWLAAHPDYERSELRFEDLGKSAWKGEHLENGFGKLRAAIEAGAIKSGDCVLIEAIDRAGRLEPTEMFPILASILKAGVNIVTLDDGVTYTHESVNGHHLFLLAAKIQQANAYSETLSRRIHKAYDKRRANAKEGKEVKRHTPLWLTSNGELIESLAPLVKQAFEDYASGLGERRICRRLRDSGHPELQTINGTTVKRWLKNQTAIGYWNEIPSVYPAVVDKELFFRVQQQLEKNKQSKRSAPTRYLLTGLAKCGHCGRNLNIKRHAKTGATMQCTSRARLSLDGCDNGRAFPKQVIEHVRVQTSLPFVQQAMASQQLTANQKRLIEIQGELEGVSKQIANLADTIKVVGLIPEVQQSLEGLQAQRQQLEQEKLILERTKEADGSVLSAITIERDFLDNDPIKLNALLQQAGYSITCYSDGLIVVSGEIYPWLYERFDRKTGSYVVRYLDEDIHIRMIRPEQEKLLEELGKIQPAEQGEDEPVNNLLKLMARSGNRRLDSE